MDVRLQSNTISYALKYRTDKKGKTMAVRESRLGARFTVAGITEYLKKKEKSRLEYEGFDRFCEKENIRDDEEEVFYGAKNFLILLPNFQFCNST